MQIGSGYKTITPIQLANIVWGVNERGVGCQAARVYFASFEMLAIRETARRYRTRRRQEPCEFSSYQPGEIARITGLPLRVVKRSLWQLDRSGLLRHTEEEIQPATEPLAGSMRLLSELACGRSFQRPVPVPRTILRFMAWNPRLALTKTIIGYLARGLSLARTDGRISNRGTVKISWVARTVGLSERAVSYSRAELIQLGWMERDTGSIQRKLNRDGAYFVINLEWKFEKKVPPAEQVSESKRREEGRTIVKPDKAIARFAPPASEIRREFAPPYKDKKTSIEIDQYQQTPPDEPTGVCGEWKGTQLKPSLRNIRVEDLEQIDRLEELYFQAAERGWIAPCDAMALNFVGAAVRAREEGDDPVRLFVSLVRKGLWHHINQGQEDEARLALNRCREENPERFRRQASGNRNRSSTTKRFDSSFGPAASQRRQPR